MDNKRLQTKYSKTPCSSYIQHTINTVYKWRITNNGVKLATLYHAGKVNESLARCLAGLLVICWYHESYINLLIFMFSRVYKHALTHTPTHRKIYVRVYVFGNGDEKFWIIAQCYSRI